MRVAPFVSAGLMALVMGLICGWTFAQELPEWLESENGPQAEEQEDLGSVEAAWAQPQSLETGRPVGAYLEIQGEERFLTKDEQIQMQGWGQAGPSLGGSARDSLTEQWKQSGYDRPVGGEEKEKRPESVMGNSPSWKDYQEYKQSKGS